MKKYYRRDVHRAARFEAGMSATDADALCTEINKGRDFNKQQVVIFDGPTISALDWAQSSYIKAAPGNWLVVKSDGTIEVHADADFQAAFVPAS